MNPHQTVIDLTIAGVVALAVILVAALRQRQLDRRRSAEFRKAYPGVLRWLRCAWRGHPREKRQVFFMGRQGVEQFDAQARCDCGQSSSATTRTRISTPYRGAK